MKSLPSYFFLLFDSLKEKKLETPSGTAAAAATAAVGRIAHDDDGEKSGERTKRRTTRKNAFVFRVIFSSLAPGKLVHPEPHRILDGEPGAQVVLNVLQLVLLSSFFLPVLLLMQAFFRFP